MTQVFELPSTILISGLPRGVQDIEMNLDAMTGETLVACLIFAMKSRISNAFASMKDATAEELDDEANRHVSEAETNEIRFGAGGGFTAKTPEELGLRDTIFSYARKKLGMKVADANKIKMTPNAFYIEYAGFLNRKESRTDVTPERVAAALLKAAQPLIEQYRAKSNPTELEI